jgi:hypothetical protein
MSLRPSSRSALLALALGAAAIGAPRDAAGQNRRSQHGTVGQRIGETEVSIIYNRPVARGRTLYGGIVGWGRTWNPGADSATTIAFGTDVQVNGEPLAAGRYTLWVIPEEREPWTVIFSRATGIWHTPYPAGQDALRLRVTPTTGEHMETLAFYFPVVEGTEATLRLHWGTTVVPLTIVGR